MKHHIRYTVLSTLVAFIIWLIGQIILILKFPDSTLWTARIWAIVILAAACIWNLMHYHRAEKKKREEKENEEYKSVY